MMRIAMILVVGGMAATANATVIGYEDFDGGAVNLLSTVNVFDYGAGGGSGGDVFGWVTPFAGGLGTGMPFDVADDTLADVSGGGMYPDDTLGIAGQYSTGFFALNDMDGSGIDPILPSATWTFDISSAISITDLSIDMAALGDFEASSLDGFFIEVQIDGGGFQEIFRAQTDEDAYKVYRPLDNGFVFEDDDPLMLIIDGVATGTYLDKSDPATGFFDSYTSVLLAGMSGSTLDVRVGWEGEPSGSEPMGIDNITINGVIPEPASLILLGLAGLLVTRRR